MYCTSTKRTSPTREGSALAVRTTLSRSKQGFQEPNLVPGQIKGHSAPHEAVARLGRGVLHSYFAYSTHVMLFNW